MIDFSKLNNLGGGENTVSQSPPVGERDNLETQQLTKAREREAWKRCQNNLVKSQRRRAEILKAIQEKKEPMGILLTAIETISLLTDDETFMKQAQMDLIKSYSGD